MDEFLKNKKLLAFPAILLDHYGYSGIEYFFGQIVQNLPGAFYICDANGRILYYNDIAADLWGRKPELGKDLWCGSWKIFKPTGESLPLDECPMAVALKEKRAVYNEEIIVERPDGLRCNILPHPRPIFNSEGELSGAFNILVDVTPLKRVQEDLRINNRELQKINLDLDNFIYTASHDLKAPVLNIEGLIVHLKKALKNKSESDSETILNMIDKSILRFKSTIQDLTEISKVHNREGEENAEISFKDVIDEVIHNSLIDKIVESGANVKVDVKECSHLRFSKKNFRSIIYNLLSNAIKYAHPDRKPEVLIKTLKKDDFVVLLCKDNGLGIKNESLPKLFTMFKRFHDHVEGSGIGLYIIKRVIDNAGGKIEAESKLGKGSTFKVFFPVAPVKPTQISAPSGG